MAYPCTLHLATVDAVVAMRSESRAGPRPRAMGTVIFSFCFFGMPVFVCRSTVYIFYFTPFWLLASGPPGHKGVLATRDAARNDARGPHTAR